MQLLFLINMLNKRVVDVLVQHLMFGVLLVNSCIGRLLVIGIPTKTKQRNVTAFFI